MVRFHIAVVYILAHTMIHLDTHFALVPLAKPGTDWYPDIRLIYCTVDTHLVKTDIGYFLTNGYIPDLLVRRIA